MSAGISNGAKDFTVPSPGSGAWAVLVQVPLGVSEYERVYWRPVTLGKVGASWFPLRPGERRLRKLAGSRGLVRAPHSWRLLAASPHYQRFPGLEEPWTVSALVEVIPGQRIDLQLIHALGTRSACPYCEQDCPVHDQAAERRWRHFDAMKFKTCLTTWPPRIRCREHRVVSV